MADEEAQEAQEPQEAQPEDPQVEELPEETKAEKKKREKEEERLKKIEAKEEDRRKQELHQHYNDVLGKVQSLQDMTATQAWRDLYARLNSRLASAKEKLVEAKGAEIAQHQQRVKVIREIFEDLQAPIGELNAFVDSAPLFAPTEVSKAEWNKGLGTVILRKLR